MIQQNIVFTTTKLLSCKKIQQEFDLFIYITLLHILRNILNYTEWTEELTHQNDKKAQKWNIQLEENVMVERNERI